ncbi:helix-turn-helix domain-containing protein [Pedobacter sp. PLR]|uniref:helix-turn-helix domain-containing protein n=1 Tax=Pedobacter sp. PLR TaxID=2994465 RepID=UPI0022472D6B|nr:helix-turn-helix domain-containing protein [Pedobacter sp. PLR]MCX2449935.1 helix-turn-helix domain-containing protein [Pedobacter sp. PLR]
MKNIARLLNDLNNMSPISAGFWNDIQPMMIEKNRKTGYVFIKPGHIANKAWQLVSGFILTIRTGPNGEEIVAGIYYPNDIVTDLESFFETIPARFKFIAGSDVTVLEIKRSDVMKLEQYPETNKLIQHVAIIGKKGTEDNNQMLRLPEEERVKFFLENYPVTGLPAHYCASFLNLNIESYLIKVEGLMSSDQIKSREAGTNQQNDLEKSGSIAYKIIAFLIANYTKPDIGNTRKIAALFNMTSVTLNRLFIKTFGCTIPKFITKRRMVDAEKMLRNETLTVGKVAIAVGYKNIYHFSKAFKSYYGYPPKQGKPNKYTF